MYVSEICKKRVDSAISLFGDKNAGGIVLLQSFKDYYYGYESVDGKPMPGYVDMMEDLNNKFPLSEPQIVGEQNQKDFIALFGAILRMRNLLLSFDDFKGKELISERDLQDYLGRYQDLRDEWKRKRQESADITDDVVFEIELIRQIEINIDYILMLVKKYHDTHCEDKEVLITINKAIDASPELRSKKQLIETFIAGINDVDDVMNEWHEYVVEQRDHDLNAIITEEKLKPEDTRKFMENAFRDGEIKTAGTDIDKLMPPISRFGGGGRAKKKQGVIDKLKTFFEKYFFLVNGTADSLITAELSNWNGKAIKIPRIEVSACNRDDIKQAGVYFLFCKEDNGKDSVYIGEAENVKERLVQHLRDAQAEKEKILLEYSCYIYWKRP